MPYQRVGTPVLLKPAVCNDASSSMNGPSSTNRPKKEEAPGPPFVPE